MPRRLVPTFLAVALLAVPLPAQAPPSDTATERMKKDIFFLAGPECEGRGIETQGINKAADYIAASFKESGLKPAFDGTYFQPFEMTGPGKLTATPKFALTGKDGKAAELKPDTDFRPLGFSGSGKAAGGLVFAGYGITAPKLKYDDYAGLDVAGKVVVVLRKTPRDDDKPAPFDPNVAHGETSSHAALMSKVQNATDHKAAAVIFVNGKADSDPDDLYAFQAHASGIPPAKFPVLHLKRAVLDKLLKAATGKTLAETESAIDKDLKPVTAALGVSATAEVSAERPKYPVKNVAGVLEGSGPHKNETVVIGAHYDHLGYGSFGSTLGTKGAGKVHYGADDNGSGTTGLLELARRFGAMKDRQGRRLVFVAFTGEERGLFGSRHYVNKPPFPLADTVAMLNLDMIGRMSPDPRPEEKDKRQRLSLFGTGTGDTFEKLVDEVAKPHDIRLSRKPGVTGAGGGSDHESFYNKQVPVLFFFSGNHDDYHKPTDTPEKINLAGMKTVVEMTEALAAKLAAADGRPKYVEVKSERTPMVKGPRLGVRPDYGFEGEGVLLEGVATGGPAEKGGLKAGDVIVEMAGKPVKDVTGYMTALAGQKSGSPLDVVVLRKGMKVPLKVTPQ